MPKYLLLLLFSSCLLFVVQSESLPISQNLATIRSPSKTPKIRIPSVKIVLLSKAITKIKNQGWRNLMKQLSGIISIQEEIDGPMNTYSLTNIKIVNLDIDKEQTNISFSTPSTISIKSANINVSVTLDYSIPVYGISSAKLTLQNVSFDFAWNVSVNFMNRYQINSANFALFIGEINNLTLGYGLQTIGNVLNGPLKNLIEKNLKSYLPNTIQNVIQDYFKSELVFFPILQALSVINMIPLTPHFTKDFLEFQLDTFFAAETKPYKRPQIDEEPEQLPDSSTYKDDLFLIINQYVLNTLGSSVFQSQSIKMNITDEDIPKFSPVRLNTTGMNRVFQNITRFYGENQPMSIICDLVDRPIFSLNNNSLSVNVSIKFDVFVNNQCAVKIQADSYFDLKLTITKGNLTMKVLKSKVYNLTISETTLMLKKDKIRGLLNLGLFAVVPYLEKNIFQKEIEIPEIPGFPNLEYGLRITKKNLVLYVNLEDD